MNDPIVVTKDLVKRGWSDFEPKLVSAMLSGSLAAGLLNIAHAYGISTPEPVPTLLPLVIAGLAGYITPSVGVTVAKKVDGNGTTAVSHSGNPVTTITASTPVQAPRRQTFTETVAPVVPATPAPPSGDAGVVPAPEHPIPGQATAAYTPDQQPTEILNSAPEPDNRPFWMRPQS